MNLSLDADKVCNIEDDLFTKTRDIFSVIEQQKNLQLQIIGLINGIDVKADHNSSNCELKEAIECLTNELRRSVESQKSIECNLNDYMSKSKMLESKKNQIEDRDKIPIISSDFSKQQKQEFQNESKNLPPIISNETTPSSYFNLQSPTEALAVPDSEDVLSSVSQNHSHSKLYISKPCFSNLRKDFKAISKPCMFIYVLDNFCHRLCAEIEDWSEPFYTNHTGYKMKAKLGYSKDCIGIYVRLVDGDFDDLLAWPFRNEISFSLLNQVNEELDITKILKPHPTDCDEAGYWIRPKFADANLGGWGLRDFIEMNLLKGPHEDYISDFVRNDRIYIKIKII